MILFSNNTVGLLSSHSLLRILSHQKYPEDFLRIWQEKTAIQGQRWDKLYEIEFQPENGKPNEKIIDFEILDTNINTMEGEFTITMVIFTDQYQQYVYQISTKFMSVGLKTISASTQIQSLQTEDCLIRQLSSYSAFDNERKASIVVMTEVDPALSPDPAPIEVEVE